MKGNKPERKGATTMTIVSKEIKTFATIKLTEKDFNELKTAFAKCSSQHIYPRAFNTFDSDYPKVINGLYDLRNAHVDTYRFIAEFYGFDGWHNAGIYNEKKSTYTMTMFIYGVNM